MGPFPFPIVPEPPVVEEPMPVEPEEPGMPPMMPGDEGSGMPPMPPMMPGEEESGMPPMMPGEEESGMPPMMPGDDMGMMSMPTPPPVNPMDMVPSQNMIEAWLDICKGFCTCQDLPCTCSQPENPDHEACVLLLDALPGVCRDFPTLPFCPLNF